MIAIFKNHGFLTSGKQNPRDTMHVMNFDEQSKLIFPTVTVQKCSFYSVFLTDRPIFEQPYSTFVPVGVPKMVPHSHPLSKFIAT